MAFSRSIKKADSKDPGGIKRKIFVKGEGLVMVKIDGSGIAVGSDEQVYVNLVDGSWVPFEQARNEVDKPEHGKIVVKQDLTIWEWQLNLDTGILKLLKIADPKPFVSLSPDEKFRYKIGNNGRRSRRW